MSYFWELAECIAPTALIFSYHFRCKMTEPSVTFCWNHFIPVTLDKLL